MRASQPYVLSLAALLSAAVAVAIYPASSAPKPSTTQASTMDAMVRSPAAYQSGALSVSRGLPRSVTVRPGDTLSGIAGNVYKDVSDWPALCDRNHLPDCDRIYAGQGLRVPRHPSRYRAPAPPAPVVAAAPVQTPAPQPPPAAPPVQSAPAPVSSSGINWGPIAQCESGGNWADDTGNGFYGGLQFTITTWLAYGGGAFAPSANLASAGDQITVANRIAFTGWNGTPPQGMGAWPVCGAKG